MENFKNKIDKKLLKIQLEIEREIDNFNTDPNEISNLVYAVSKIMSIRKLFRDGKIDWMNFGKESK